MRFLLSVLLTLSSFYTVFSQMPQPALVGYWHNWHTSSAPGMALTAVDVRYNVINVAFGIPINGTDYQIGFTPFNASQSTFITQINTVKAQNRRVLLSLGGGNDPIKLDNVTERDIFISSVNVLLATYPFDGLDIDFEDSSLSVSGGTIANPTDAHIQHLIFALKSIMSTYRSTHSNQKMLLTMAPETAFVQGGQSAWNGVWGAYLPVIYAMRDSLDRLMVQLYNSGSMYGINGGIYTQGTADFIVAMTEATIQGFSVDRWSNQAGPFIGLPASKIAVGLPACPSAAGGGFTDTATVGAAMRYLRGTGPKPGAYTLVQSGGYPNLGGMMTWSVNWDAPGTCNNSTYQFAQNYARIFGTALPAELLAFQAERLGSDQILLTWQVGQEDQLETYTVQRSTNATVWESIETLSAERKTVYTTYDEPQTTGLVYYRLAMEDYDGTLHYSKIVSVHLAPTLASCAIYPNPADQLVHVCTDFDQVSVRLVHASGIEVMQIPALQSNQINVANLAEGIYFILMEQRNGQQSVQKLVIKRS